MDNQDNLDAIIASLHGELNRIDQAIRSLELIARTERGEAAAPLRRGISRSKVSVDGRVCNRRTHTGTY